MLCSRCDTENREGRRFCAACGAPLGNPCPACGTPNAEDERFCGECGAPLGAVQPPASSVTTPPRTVPERQPPAEPDTTAEERRLATVLFCDLAGFTSMSEEMDHEDVKALASHCAELMSKEVQRFGGTVTVVMGDAIMGLFGAPVAYEDDPERAVRAAMSIRELVKAVKGAPKTLQIHAGINTGETMTGLVGSADRRDYTAMGDTTNTAARLMSAAPTGTILVGELTYLATRHAVSYREAEPVLAKGKSAPVRAWEVEGVSAVPAPRPLGTAPFVGRRDELDALAATWAEVWQDAQVRSATVIGPAGIGKTRLLRESLSRLPGVAHAYWGRCLPYGEGITYWPLVEIVKSAAGISHDDDLAVGSAKLGDLLESLPRVTRDEARSMAIALANLLSVPATPRGTYEARTIAKGELHWGLGRVFEALALTGPTIVVFEDLHWAEPTLLEFVAHLGGLHARVPLFVLASARPELLETAVLPGGDGSLIVRLHGLGDEESRTILADLLGKDAGAASGGELLLRNAEGNPLFLEETVRMLVSAGVLEEGRQIGDLKDIAIPTSVQGLIGSRLDLLPSEQRRLAQHCSVVGQVFWPGAVAHVGAWPSGVDEGLEGLVARDVLEPHRHSSVAGEREYAFRHVLIRDVAYRRLPKGERAVLHERCADWIAALPGGKDELIEFVAYHLEQACALAPAFGPAAELRPQRRTVDALMAAAEKAEQRDGIREAHRFYARALAVLGADVPELATEVRLKHARMTSALGELSRAEEELRAVVDEARHVGRADLRGHALVALANVYLKQGRAKDAGLALVEAQEAALQTGDRWLQIRASYEFAALRGDFGGDVEGAIEELQGAIAVAMQLGDRALRVEGLMRESNLLVNVGRLVEAETVLAECAELAGRLGSRRDEARASFLLALVSYYRLGPEQAEELALPAHEWLQRIGDGYFLPQSLRALAKYALADGRPELAEVRLRAALSLAEEEGGWVVVELYRYLTQALVDQGRASAAAEAAALARKAVPPEDGYARAAALFAEVLAASADPGAEPAWQLFVESIALMEEQQLWIDVAEARVDYADALSRRGKPAEAEAELRAARSVFKRTGADALVARIDARSGYRR